MRSQLAYSLVVVRNSRLTGNGERRLAPAPKEASDRQVIVAVMAGWVLALVVLLAVQATLPGDVRWWIWTCVVGIAFGVFGLWYVPFLKGRRARVAAAHARLAEARRAGPEGPVPEGPVPGSSAPDAQPSAPDSGYVSRDNGSNTVSSTETPGKSTRS